MMTYVKAPTIYSMLKNITLKKAGIVKFCHVNLGSDKKHHLGISESHLHPLCGTREEKDKNKPTFQALLQNTTIFSIQK